MDVLIIGGALVLVGVLAYFFGHDSRDAFDSRDVYNRRYPDEPRIWS